jgi:integrase
MKMIEPCLQEAIHYGNISEEELILAIEIVRQKKQTFLNAHEAKHRITEEKNGYFSTYVPDESKPKGLRQIKKKTREELEEAIIQYYKKGGSSVGKEREVKICFAEVVKQAILAKTEKGNLSATTNRKMSDFYSYVKGSAIGKKAIDAVTIDDIIDYMMETIRTGYRGDKSRKKAIARNGDIRLQEQTAKNLRTIIVQGIKYANRKGWSKIDANNLFETLKTEMDCDIYYVPQDNDLDYVLTDTQLRAVINLIDGMDYDDWKKVHSKDSAVVDQGIKLVAFCGCRVGELCSLKWTDIQDYVMSLQRRESRGRAFNEKGEPGEYTFSVLPGLKKRKPLRAIPITSRMELIFTRLKELAPASEYVFVRQDGKRIREKAFSDRLKVLCRLAGVPERSIHKLRFSYISRTAKTMPTKVLTELTGSTVRMINYYNKNTAEMQEIRAMMERAECL